MRRICEVAFPVLLVACTPVGAESQTREPVEAAAASADPAAQWIDLEQLGQPPVVPSAQPKLEVVARDLGNEQRHDGYCPFQVQLHAFPAISDDGTALLAAKSIDIYPQDLYVVLTWLDADETRVESIFNKEPKSEDENCDIALERVREQVAALNTELAARTWRPLERLDVLFSKQGMDAAYAFVPAGLEPAGIDEVVDAMPIADRPVEVYYHGGHFIARVRAAKVLQKTSRPEWLRSEHNNEFCGNEVLITAIEFDRTTSLALVHYNFNGENGCLCSDPGMFGRVELSPELLAEAELRSMEKFLIASKLAAEQM
jgi:hypothetical protein